MAATADASTAGGHRNHATSGTTVAKHISALRDEIDSLDTKILELVAERIQLSQQVQTARLADGGVRLEQSRERTVVGRYRDALGDDGVRLADAILRASRGNP